MIFRNVDSEKINIETVMNEEIVNLKFKGFMVYL